MKINIFPSILLSILLFLFLTSCEQQRKTIDISGSNWTFHKNNSDTIMKAKVPGSVHMDLLANKVIPDPYYRTNEDSLQWIGEKDWVYETEFSIDPDILKMKNVDIVFKGLDTYADVYLNDVKILHADNFFREWRHRVKNLLKEKDNKLKIKFTSPVKIDKYRMTHDKIPLIYDYAYTRKPAYHFGWDWGPVFITQGVWQPVVIEGWDKARFTNFRIYKEKVSEKEAQLILLYEIESDEDVTVTINAECVNTGQTVSNKFELKKGKNKAGLFLNIDNPKLWWPNGYGDPNLYSFKSEMKINYKTVDTISGRTGIRTVKLVQKPDSIGKSFYFEVNGVPVFMKGANYIPQDMFLNRPTAEDYKKLINDAKEANMNMLRVWGGGFYEKDIFYNLCDENGIMVWQDFMFACAMYPGDKAFLDNVKHEAVQQVKRLRNHPCIALYCGNNEIDEAWHNWGWQKRYNKKERKIIWRYYRKLFEDILPGVVKEYNPEISYWPSSPSTTWSKKLNTSGDAHYWGVWHGQYPFEAMKKPEHIGRFVSEYGFQSIPEFSSIKKFTKPEDWSIDSKVMRLHQKHRIGYPVIDKYIKWYYKQPKDFQAYIYVSQVMQQFGIDMGIEAHRRAKPMCMGTLYWQLNDCYPVASWSSIDYYDKWKALHYKVKEIYKTFLVSPVEEDGKFKVYVVSDKTSPQRAVLLIEVYDFNGKLINKYDKTVNIPENSSAVYFTEDIESLSNMHSKNDLVVITKLITPEKSLAENEFFFVSPKDLKLSKPEIKITSKKVDDGYELILNADKFAKNVFLSTDNGKGFFTNNYFDLIPGIPVTLTFKTDTTIDNIKNSVKIYSLVDSY